jgi:hypothetical protein
MLLICGRGMRMWMLLALAVAALLMAACLATGLTLSDNAAMALFLAASVAISLFLVLGLGTYGHRATFFPVRNYGAAAHQ